MRYQDEKPLYQAADSGEGFKFALWGIAIAVCFVGGVALVLIGAIS